MRQGKTARHVALTALERCRRAGAWSDDVAAATADEYGLSGRERALAAAICLGVMQNRFLLDYYIDCYSSVKTRRLEPKVLDILRVSAYQLLFMDRIPAPAAVSEGVDLSRTLGYARAAGLVNAVLRRLSENRDALPPVRGKTRAEELSIRYSCPLWLTQYALDMLGAEEAEALLRCQNEPVPIFCQVNPVKTTAEVLVEELRGEGFDARSHPWLSGCVELSGTGAVSALTAFREGKFYVQDPAAFLAVLAAAPRAGERVLDVCAAPGGKSFAVSALTGGKSFVTACDLHEKKLGRIRAGAERLGFDGITVCQGDARVFRPEWEGAFDLVLADVPCSGLGVIRKKPDIRYKDQAAFAGLPEIQSAILENASRYVRPGGTLLYSTCTFRREENEDVVSAFLQKNGAYLAEDFTLPGDVRSGGGMCRLYPQRHGTDGFFIAKFRKTKGSWKQ